MIAAVVLIASAVGGWYWGNSSGSVDGRLTEPGVVAYPAISTNKDLIGSKLPDVELTSLDRKSVV